MTDLILYLSMAVVGYLVASRLSKHQLNFSWTGKAQTVAIVLLVLTMGMRMGCNEEVISNLNMIGVYALCFTVVNMTFSVIAIFLLRKAMGIDRYGYFAGEKITGVAVEAPSGEEKPAGGKFSDYKMSIMIVITVSIGLFSGYAFVDKIFHDPQTFIDLAGNGIRVGLSLLLFLIGFDMGREGTFIRDFKDAGAKVIVFPLAVAVGTLAGAFVCSFIVPGSIREALAIGAGFGWYSFAPVVILENGFVMASAIAFMHNIMRAMTSMLFIPIVAKKVGYLETLGLPASCALDICLPIITKSTRSGIAIYSFISGLTLSILVPILVPLFIG